MPLPVSALTVSASARVAESGLSRVTLRLPLATIAITVAIVETAVLADREIGGLALRRLTFWARERRPDQRPVHRPFITIIGSLRLTRLTRRGFALRLARDRF
jgi:hypothetical protein